MTRVRRAGARWRVLAHEVLAAPRDGLRYGAAFEVTSDGRATPSATTTVLPGTELDEVVVGEWLHLEQLDRRHWHLDVGGVVLAIEADRDGRPTAVTVHGPGDYASPVDGCRYAMPGDLTATTVDSVAERYLPGGWSRALVHSALNNLVDDGDEAAIGAVLQVLDGYRPGRGRRATGGAS